MTDNSPGAIAGRLGTHFSVDPPPAPNLHVQWGELSRGNDDTSAFVRDCMRTLGLTVLIPTSGWEFIPLVVAQSGPNVVAVSWARLNPEDDVSFTVAGISADSASAEATRNRVRDEIHNHKWVLIDNADEGSHPVPEP